MLIVFQLLFILFALLAVGSIVKRKRKGMLEGMGFVFWIIFWIGSIVAVMQPNMVTVVANHFGIGRGSDFVFYISLAIIFFILFRLYVKIESINRDITRVVRKDALESTKEKKKPHTDI